MRGKEIAKNLSGAFGERKMTQQHTNATMALTVVLSVILISCLISWELIVPFALPIISRHMELLFLLLGWGMAAVSFFRILKDLPDSKEYSAKEIKWFILWLVTFTTLNIILYFVRLNLFSDPDIKDVLWEQRLYFLNIILSFLPWAFVLLGAKAAVFEKTVNYVAAVTQISYFVQCVCIGSWYMPLGNKNRIDVLYAGLIAFPLVTYCLCAGRFTKKADQLLAGINIALCLFFAWVGTSRLAIVLVIVALLSVAVSCVRIVKRQPQQMVQVKYAARAVLIGALLVFFVMAMDVFDARGNVSRGLSFIGSEYDSTIENIDEYSAEELKGQINTRFSLWHSEREELGETASAKSPPDFSDVLRVYWRKLAIGNNLKSPIITSGRMSYTYTTPTGWEYRGGAHHAIIDYWSLFGLIGLGWIGVFGIYLFTAQIISSPMAEKSGTKMFILPAITAEAISFGFAILQCVYIQPFTFTFLIMVTAWCRAMNNERVKE